jgi:hypothetical protein
MSGIVFDRREAVCYRRLVGLLHPRGLSCPHCGSGHTVEAISEFEDGVPRHDCSICGRSFNAWTGTLLQGAGSPPSEMLAELLAALEAVGRRGPGPDLRPGYVL